MDLPKRIALYENVEFGNVSLDDADSWIEESNSYLRVTDILEIELCRRAPEEITPVAILQLRKVIESIRAKAHKEVASVEDRILDLLALTHQTEHDNDVPE